MWRLIFSLLLALAAWGQTNHPILAVGSPAPDFSLRGADGRIHRLDDFAASPVLVVVFTCNHCPIAQMYEQRVQQLETDYRKRGVAVVAIQPDDPKAIRIIEVGVAEMLECDANFHFIEAVAERMGNSYRKEMVNTQDARNAVDALLANREVPVKHTGIFGCSTKWQGKTAPRMESLRRIEKQPVQLEMATAPDLKALRENPAKHMVLISFWATWCGSCIDEFYTANVLVG